MVRDAFRHPQRIEESIDHHLDEWLAGLLLDDCRQVVVASAVILEFFSGRSFGCMSDQVLDLDRVVLEVGRVMRHRLIEFSLFHQLHDEGRRERLRDGGDGIKGVRGGGNPVLEVSVTEPSFPHYFLVLHDDRRHPWDL